MRNSQSEKFKDLMAVTFHEYPHLADVVADEKCEERERDLALADILRMVADVLEYGLEPKYDQ